MVQCTKDSVFSSQVLDRLCYSVSVIEKYIKAILLNQQLPCLKTLPMDTLHNGHWWSNFIFMPSSKNHIYIHVIFVNHNLSMLMPKYNINNE